MARQRDAVASLLVLAVVACLPAATDTAFGLSGIGQLFGSSKSVRSETPEVTLDEIRRLRMQNLASVAAVLLHGDQGQARAGAGTADGLQHGHPPDQSKTLEGLPTDDLTGPSVRADGSLWGFGCHTAVRDCEAALMSGDGCEDDWSGSSRSRSEQQNSQGGSGPSIEDLLEEVQRLRAENQVLKAHHDQDKSAGGVSKLVMHAMGLEGMLKKSGAGSLQELRVNNPEAAVALEGWNKTIANLLENGQMCQDAPEGQQEYPALDGAEDDEWAGAVEVLSSRVRQGNKRTSASEREATAYALDGEGHEGERLWSEAVGGERFCLSDLSSRAGRSATGRRTSTSYRSQSDVSHGQARGEQAILSSQRQQIIVWLLWNTCIRDQKNPAAFLALCRQLYEQGILESLGFLSDLPALERSLTSAFHQLFGVPSVAEAVLHASGSVGALEGGLESSQGIEGPGAGGSVSGKNNLQAIVPGDVFQHAREQEMKALDPTFAPTRYEKEFDELGILGRGGYGTVTTAKHRIDQQLYAIKRIRIKSVGLSACSRPCPVLTEQDLFSKFRSSSISKRLHDRVLCEARAIAALQHPNIVRYYTTWLEVKWKPATGAARQDVSSGAADSAQRPTVPPTLGLAGDAAAAAASSVEQVDLYEKIPTLLRKDTDWDSLSGVDESEDVVNVVGADDTGVAHAREGDVDPLPGVSGRWQEKGASVDALDVDVSGVCHDAASVASGDVVGAIVPLVADRGKREGEKQGRGLVAANSNPNGWHPHEWGSTLEADMEVVIQMEHCGFVTLEKVLERDTLSALVSTSIFVQVLKGLAEVHSRGLMHRDIKPANLFITQEGEWRDIIVKVGDFGLSTAHSIEGVRGMDVEEDYGTTHERGRLQHTVGSGTPTYMAPEQMGGKYYSEQCDVYAAGVVYLQMVAGFKTVMQRVDALDAAGRISEICDDPQQIPLPDSVCAYPRIAALIRQTLAYAPNMRPSAAAALDEAVSIWRELLRDMKASECSNVRCRHVDADCDADWDDCDSESARAPGYIDSRLFARWSRQGCSGTLIH